MSAKFLQKLSPRKRGIIYLLLSSFAFACMALFINLAGDMPVFQKAFFRNLVAIVMSYIMLARSPEKFKIKKGSPYNRIRKYFMGLVAAFAIATLILKINWSYIILITFTAYILLNLIIALFSLRIVHK